MSNYIAQEKFCQVCILICMYNETEILKQFGRNIKAERIRKGYTQESFAEKIIHKQN